MKTPETATTSRPAGTVSPPARGDYLCSDSDLYYVEQAGPGRVVLEDCRTGTLLDLSITDIAKLRRVTPASSSA